MVSWLPRWISSGPAPTAVPMDTRESAAAPVGVPMKDDEKEPATPRRERDFKATPMGHVSKEASAAARKESRAKSKANAVAYNQFKGFVEKDLDRIAAEAFNDSALGCVIL